MRLSSQCADVAENALVADSTSNREKTVFQGHGHSPLFIFRWPEIESSLH